MSTVSKMSNLISRTMKFSVPKLVFLIVIMVLPTVMIANKSRYADPEQRSTVLPVSASASFSKKLTASSLMFFNTGLAAAGLPFEAFEQAIRGFSKLRERNLVSEDSVLTIVDFTKSSKEKRLYVIDLKNQDILFQTVVAHGRNSGQEYARSFSNKPSSNKSSLGFYVTQGTYMGSNGYSLKLLGTETGINDMALARAIVMHGADYANENVVNTKGYLGRSFGCPALPQKLNKKIIDRIKNGNALFVYYPDPNYIKKSKLLNG